MLLVVDRALLCQVEGAMQQRALEAGAGMPGLQRNSLLRETHCLLGAAVWLRSRVNGTAQGPGCHGRLWKLEWRQWPLGAELVLVPRVSRRRGRCPRKVEELLLRAEERRG